MTPVGFRNIRSGPIGGLPVLLFLVHHDSAVKLIFFIYTHFDLIDLIVSGFARTKR